MEFWAGFRAGQNRVRSHQGVELSIRIDPQALNAFASQAASHSNDLKAVRVTIDLPPQILGSFEEATDLVGAINAHTSQVNQRLQATSEALFDLAQAASAAAKLSGSSDAEIATQMTKINNQVDEARRKLAAPKL